MTHRLWRVGIVGAFFLSACGQVSGLEADGESEELLESADPALSSIDYIYYNITVTNTPKICRIESTGTCALHPTTVFPLNDNYQSSATNTARCLARAAEYAKWCGIAANKYVTAKSIGDRTYTYTPKRAGVAAKAPEVFRNVMFGKQEWAMNGCMVALNGGCPKHPSLNGNVVMDTAATTNAQCTARLSYWVQYCAAPEAQNYAYGSFFSAGAIVNPQGWFYNICLNRSCVGKPSDLDPQARCFRNDWYTPFIKDAAGRWALNLEWDSAPECSGIIAAKVTNWSNGAANQTMSVWLEKAGVGVIPGSRRSITGTTWLTELGSTVQAAGGVTRGCASITAGGGNGAASGCTAWH